MARQSFLIVGLLLLFGVAVSDCREGLSSIFEKFLNVTDLLGGMPPILEKIAADIVDDIRDLIPEIESLLAKHNITDGIFSELGKMLNVTRINHELIPELDDLLDSQNITEKLDEIIELIEVRNINEKLMPEVQEFLESNNVSAAISEFKDFLNISRIADELLPDFQDFVESSNLAKIIDEIMKFLNVSEIGGNLIRTMEKILENDDVEAAILEAKMLLNITHISDKLLPELERFINDSNIFEIIAEVRKYTNITHTGGELLDELQKLLDESNITRDEPDLKPFLNVSVIREKLPEIQRILDQWNVSHILDEIEMLLNVSYLREKLPEVEEIMERFGITRFLSDLKALLEVDSVADQTSELEEMLESIGLNSTLSDLEELLELDLINDKISVIEELLGGSNWTYSIPNIKELINASYIRAKIVPEIERILERINLTAMLEEAERLANATYLRSNVVPKIERFLRDHNITDKLKELLRLLNTTYLKRLLNEIDEKLNITAKGERISEGELSDVVNDILDQIFEQNQNSVDEEPTTTHSSTQLPTTSTPPVSTVTTTGGAETAETMPTTVPVCQITDCHDVPCGTAIINSCSVCVKGTTGLLGNHGKDCNNVCNGTARNDSCNACTNPPANDPTSNDSPFADCSGTCFGSAVIDSCGNCSGGETGKAVDFRKDACNVCGGDNSTCVGCDAVPNSGKVNDSCGVCGGDGSSCTAISIVVPSLLPTTSSTSRTVDVYGAGFDGDAIKCFFGGVESAGTLGNRTHCQCSIPNGDVGTKDFTVKVVKNNAPIATSNLQITLYDATAVKVTGLQPSEMFTKETTAVTFDGSGFVGLDSSAAVCVINATKVKAVLAGASYTCTVPEFAKSVEISLALSLNGVHELVSDVSLARTVYARAPTLTKAQFSDTGALIDVEFDKDVDTTPLTSCSDVFASVSLLGTSPDCSWSDGRHLTINPGASVQILPGATLTLKTNAVKCGGEQHSKYAAGSVTVGAPTNPAEPVSVIVGPTQISSCGHLSLDGSQSSGGGGRDLKYVWSLVGTTDDDITAVLNLANDNAKVFVNGTLMSSGTSYSIKLAVQNFLGSAWKESTIVVTKASDPLPEVTVHGPLRGKILAANSFYITALAKAASCSSSKTLVYTWSVLCTNNDQSGAAKTKAESSLGFQQTSSKYALKIDAGSLVGGKTYEFTVVVALEASPSTATTVKTTVMVDWSPLEPAITGGDRTLGRDAGSLILDAESSTVDPDNAVGDLSCSWICMDLSNQQPCYSAVNIQNKIVLPNQCVVTVPSTEFAVDKLYEITSQVSKGSRTGSSSVVVTVVAGKPPEVRVLTGNIKVVASDKVALQGIYTSSTQPTEVEWICAQDENYRYIDLSDTSLLRSTSYQYNPSVKSFAVIILKANVLTPGASYKFILNVDDGSKVGSSNMVVEVRSGPTSGTFDVSPTTLEPLDMVTLAASLSWVTDSDAYPLQYEFGFVDGSGIFHPWITQTSNEYSIPAPPGHGAANKLTLGMKVKDAFGSMKWLEKNITVNPATLIDEGEVEVIIERSLQEAKDTGDYSNAVPNMMNILRAVSSNANVSENFAKKVTNSTLSTLLLAVDSTSLDEEKAAPILKTFLEVDADYVEQAEEVLGGFKEVIKAAEKNIDKQTVEETLKWIDDLSSKADLNDEDVLKNLASVDDSLASSLADNVGFGQPAIETSADNSRAVIKVAHTTLMGSIQTKTSEDATEVDFGNELGGKYGGVWDCAPGKECLGVKVKMINYKKDYYSGISSSKPSILSDKILSISLQNPETGDDLSVSGLDDPIKLTFKTGPPSAGKTLVCFYYNETDQKWSSDGMTWSMVSDVFTVFASHFTSFSPAEEDDTSTQAPITDKNYQVSFVLSNTTWKESYLDSNHPDTIALKNKILQEFNEIYKNDPSMKSSRVEKFEKSGVNNVKVVIQTTFSGTNTNPSEKLKLSLADGMFGDLAVAANSLDWVEAYDQSSFEDDDNTSLIIGIVVGVCVAVCIIATLIAFLVYHSQKVRKRKVHSRPVTHVNEYDNDGMDNHEMLPV